MGKYTIKQGGEIFIIKAGNRAEEERAYLLRIIKNGEDNPFSEAEFSENLPQGEDIEVTVFLKGVSQIKAEFTPSDKGDAAIDNYGSLYMPIADFDEPVENNE